MLFGRLTILKSKVTLIHSGQSELLHKSTFLLCKLTVLLYYSTMLFSGLTMPLIRQAFLPDGLN